MIKSEEFIKHRLFKKKKKRVWKIIQVNLKEKSFKIDECKCKP